MNIQQNPLNVNKSNTKRLETNLAVVENVLRPDIFKGISDSFNEVYSPPGELVYNIDFLDDLKSKHDDAGGNHPLGSWIELSEHLNTESFWSQIKDIFLDYLSDSDEFLLDIDQIRMKGHDLEYQTPIPDLQLITRKQKEDDRDLGKFDRHSVFSIINPQNRNSPVLKQKKATGFRRLLKLQNRNENPPVYRLQKGLHRDHEFRIFTLLIYFSDILDGTAQTTFWSGNSIKDPGTAIHSVSPRKNTAVLFLNNRKSIHSASANIHSHERPTIYIAIGSNLPVWKYISKVNDLTLPR